MGFFDTIGNIKTFEQSNNWFFPGEYTLDVSKILMERSQKVGSKKVLAKIFLNVQECDAPPGTSGKAPYKPGDEVKVFWDVNNDLVLPNAIDFVMAAGEQFLWSKGASEAKVREFLNDFKESDKLPHPRTKHMDEVLGKGPDSIVKGVTLKVSAFNKPKSDGTPFTRLRWIPTLRPKGFDPKG